MRTIIRSLRRDHREIEGVLRALEQECELFRRAERPDYELLAEMIGFFRSFLDEYHRPKEDFMFDQIRTENARCSRILADVVAERAAAASCLQDLDHALRDILSEQRVLRQAFDDAASGFIQHERRQIEIEEQQLFPAALAVLTTADWADVHARLRNEKVSRRTRRLKEKLRAQHRWIDREASADQAERSAAGAINTK